MVDCVRGGGHVGWGWVGELHCVAGEDEIGFVGGRGEGEPVAVLLVGAARFLEAVGVISICR